MTVRPHLSPMLSRLRESATISATRRARELKKAGRDVLVISGGEPDFDTPRHIKSAAMAAIEAGQTKYTSTDGTQEQREAVAAKFARENSLPVSSEEVIVGTGAKQIIFNALLATVGAGDEAIIPTPSWVSYADIVELAGDVPVLVECSRADRFKDQAGDPAPGDHAAHEMADPEFAEQSDRRGALGGRAPTLCRRPARAPAGDNHVG